MGQDDVVEEVGDRLLAIVDAAADEIGGIVRVVLEVVGIAVVFRARRAVQPMALDRQFLPVRVGLDRLADIEIVLRVEQRRRRARAASWRRRSRRIRAPRPRGRTACLAAL